MQEVDQDVVVMYTLVKFLRMYEGFEGVLSGFLAVYEDF